MKFSNTSPYCTVVNTTETDADEGRACIFEARGEQSGGEETVLGELVFCHDGAVDDQKGQLILRLNDGADGVAPTDVLTVLSNGNVGIGTTEPEACLHIKKDSIGENITDGLYLANTIAATDSVEQYSPAIHLRGNQWIGVASSITDWWIYVPGSGGYDRAILNFDYSKNEGAKTTAFSFNSYNNTFQVNVGANFYWDGRSVINSPASGQLAFMNAGQDGFTRLNFGVYNSSSFPALAVNGSDLQVIRADGSTNADLLVTGNVGIGTATPLSKLDVNIGFVSGDFRTRGIVQEYYGHANYFKGFVYTVAQGTFASPTIVTTSTMQPLVNTLFYDGTYYRIGATVISDVSGVSAGTNVASELQFWTGTVTGNAASGAITGLIQQMVIDKTGNVGIGTTTPNQKLTVEGTLDLKEQAAAEADTDAYGQIWVKDDTPNELYFTDDAGTDTLISPHAKDAPPDFYEPDEVPGRVNIHKQVHKYSGVVVWERGHLYREEPFAKYNARRAAVPGHVDLVQQDWDVYQQRQIEATKTRRDEWLSKLEEYRAAVAKWKRLPWPLRGELPSPPGDEPHVHEYESNPLIGAM